VNTCSLVENRFFGAGDDPNHCPARGARVSDAIGYRPDAEVGSRAASGPAAGAATARRARRNVSRLDNRAGLREYQIECLP
jgi:hypothetical protein